MLHTNSKLNTPPRIPMKNALKLFLLLCSGMFYAASAWSASFSALYVFGDSLSDAGNSQSAALSIYGLINGCDPNHACPPYADGHFSNGPTASEYLANSLFPGAVTPANYQSFAVGGATTGVGNIADGGTTSMTGSLGLPGMAVELGAYLARSGSADANALYLIWGGANDFVPADAATISQTAELAATNIAGYVGLLASKGATHFLVPNIPDLGLTPALSPTSWQAAGSLYSSLFNAALAAKLDALDQAMNLDIMQFDTQALISKVITDPVKYGFSNAEDACLYASQCEADKYVFWDGMHPTTKAHSLLAMAFANTVPEPGSILLLALALLLLVGRVRGKRHPAGIRVRLA